MRATPTDLIEVSFHADGRPQRCFVSAARLDYRIIAGGCVAEYRSDGSPIRKRQFESFEYDHAMLSVANIIERGNPALADGWRDRAVAWEAARWEAWTKDDRKNLSARAAT